MVYLIKVDRNNGFAIILGFLILGYLLIIQWVSKHNFNHNDFRNRPEPNFKKFSILQNVNALVYKIVSGHSYLLVDSC